MDLEAAIAAQTKDTPPNEVTELVLDTCKATKVSGLEKFSNLKSLTLNGCGLTTLDGLNKVASIGSISVSDCPLLSTFSGLSGLSGTMEGALTLSTLRSLTTLDGIGKLLVRQ